MCLLDNGADKYGGLGSLITGGSKTKNAGVTN